MSALNRPTFSPLLVLAMLLLALAVWVFAPAEAILHWTAEHGPIEMSTAVMFVVAAVVALARFAFDRTTRGSAFALALLLLACAARELDWHIELTGMSILKSRFYLGDAPLAHKLGALAVVGVLAAAGLYLLRRHGRQLLQGFRRSSAAAVTAVTAGAVLVGTKLLDRSLGVLSESFGVSSSQSVYALQAVIEEPFELGLPVLVIVGLLQARSPGAVTQAARRPA